MRWGWNRPTVILRLGLLGSEVSNCGSNFTGWDEKDSRDEDAPENIGATKSGLLICY